MYKSIFVILTLLPEIFRIEPDRVFITQPQVIEMIEVLTNDYLSIVLLIWLVLLCLLLWFVKELLYNITAF